MRRVNTSCITKHIRNGFFFHLCRLLVSHFVLSFIFSVSLFHALTLIFSFYVSSPFSIRTVYLSPRISLLFIPHPKLPSSSLDSSFASETSALTKLVLIHSLFHFSLENIEYNFILHRRCSLLLYDLFCNLLGIEKSSSKIFAMIFA